MQQFRITNDSLWYECQFIVLLFCWNDTIALMTSLSEKNLIIIHLEQSFHFIRVSKSKMNEREWTEHDGTRVFLWKRPFIIKTSKFSKVFKTSSWFSQTCPSAVGSTLAMKIKFQPDLNLSVLLVSMIIPSWWC